MGVGVGADICSVLNESRVRHVVHDNEAVRAAVVRGRDGAEPLLAGSVPLWEKEGIKRVSECVGEIQRVGMDGMGCPCACECEWVGAQVCVCVDWKSSESITSHTTMMPCRWRGD